MMAQSAGCLERTSPPLCLVQSPENYGQRVLNLTKMMSEVTLFIRVQSKLHFYRQWNQRMKKKSNYVSRCKS